MRRTVIFAFLASLGGCVAPSARSTPDPLPDVTDFQRRDECLYREVARLISERGDGPTTLDTIAGIATGLCSQEILIKLQRHNWNTPDAIVMEREDKSQTERRAFAIGPEIKERRAKK
jgi:hypothetical protein